MLTDHLAEFGFTTSYVENSSVAIRTYHFVREDSSIDAVLFFSTADGQLDDILSSIAHKFVAVLANGYNFDHQRVYSAGDIIDLIDQNCITLTPTEKLDSVLVYLSEHTEYEGERILSPIMDDFEVAKMGFTNVDEWWFYLESAVQLGLIDRQWTGEVVHPQFDNTKIFEYGLTVNGLSRLITVTGQKTSRYAFIAMAFQDDMDTIYTQGIAPVVIECGFEPYIVNRVHMASDETINDGIIAGLKKARFTIADFTYLKAGVYFEADYALGRGQKVIYSCREDFIDKLHFDLRNYQHIVWKNVDDFKAKLRDKIEAFIID